LMRNIRSAIENGTLDAFASAFRAEQAQGDIERL
jgi:queuine/archaeosine tRNA-ribosyltransferase